MRSDGERLIVRLSGGCPWGFRLQGGVGTGKPLTVYKVRRKSKAHNALFEGDLIVGINGRPCDRMTHDQAMAIVDEGGSHLALELIRNCENKENLSKDTYNRHTDATSVRKDRTNESIKKTQPWLEKPKRAFGMETESAAEAPKTAKEAAPDSESVPAAAQSGSSAMEVDEGTCPPNNEDDAASPNDVQRSVTREVTSDDKSYHELSTETVHEKRGNTESVSFVKEEHSISVDGASPGDGRTTVISPAEKSLLATDAPNSVRETKSTVRSEETTDSTNSGVVKVTKYESKSSETSTNTVWQDQDAATTNGIDAMKDDASLRQTNSPASSAFSSLTTSEMSTTTETTHSPFSYLFGKTTTSKQRPISAPPMDFDIFHAINYGMTKTDGNESGPDLTRGTSTERSSTPLSHVYLPAMDSDSEQLINTLRTRKKMFSSSSFYDEPRHIYPTVEEQVELCRKIADSLSDDTNKKSRGANMFFKRVKRSNKWVHEGPYPNSSAEGSMYNSDSEAPEPPTPDPSTMPYLRVSKGPPQLKLILDPRQLQDASKLRSAGQNVNEHNVVSPDICLDLVKDLNSPVGRGAALFAKRKMKSEEWVVDEGRVRAHLEQKARETSETPEPTLPSISYVPPAVPPLEKIQERLLQNPRVKLVKSPWEAALESPIGSVDGAFAETSAEKVAQTVIQRAADLVAESEMNDYFVPPPAPTQVAAPAPALQFATPPSQQSIYCTLPRIYRPKAPRGWTGSTAASSASESAAPPPPPQRSQIPYYEPAGLSPATLLSQQQKPSLPSFQNFNASPKSWSASQQRSPNASFRSVRIPTVATH